MKESTVSQVTISAEEAGQRLDNYLIKWAKGVPKSHIYRIIRSGEVRINKKRADVTQKVLEGDIVRIPPIRVAAPTVQSISEANLRLLEYFFLLPKPARLDWLRESH